MVVVLWGAAALNVASPVQGWQQLHPPKPAPARGAPGEGCVIDEQPPGSVLCEPGCSPCQQHSCPVKRWVKCNCDPFIAYSGGAFQSLGTQAASAAVCS